MEGAVFLPGVQGLGLRLGCVLWQATALAGYALAEERCPGNRACGDHQAQTWMALAAALLSFHALVLRRKHSREHGADAALHTGDDARHLRQAVGSEKRDAGDKVALLVTEGGKAA